MPVPACGSRRACEGASSEAEVSPRVRQNPLKGDVSPRARRNPLEGEVSPRARRNPLEGDVSPRARRNPLEGEVSPRARRNPLEGEVSPRARRNPLEGEVSPRARRNLLEGAFDWATPVGRGGHHSVGRAVCACSGKRCVLLLFLQLLSRIPPVFRGPSGLSPTLLRDSGNQKHKIRRMGMYHQTNTNRISRRHI
jgi:hypothetical protein